MSDGITLTDQDWALLTGVNFAHLATLRRDGTPHVAPVWIDAREGRILVNTAEGRVKLANVRRDPRVALSLTDSRNPYRMLSVTGRVVAETAEEPAERHIDELSRRYNGQEYPDHGGRVVLEIRPERVARMGY